MFESKIEEVTGEKERCMMGNFIMSTLHQILVAGLSQGRLEGLEKCMQKLRYS
jgi:hypothetical protein